MPWNKITLPPCFIQLLKFTSTIGLKSPLSFRNQIKHLQQTVVLFVTRIRYVGTIQVMTEDVGF
jgi:hypothetical protein